MWSDFSTAAPDLLHGLGITLVYTLVGAVAALAVSFVLGLAALSPYVAVRFVIRMIVEFFRGTSLVIQLIWFAYVLPQLDLGFKLEPLGVAVVVLAMNFGAYGSEIVRGAVGAVPKAQWEATIALSLSPTQRMRRVVLPQAWPEMIPPFCNLLVQMLKSSSLLFLIGVTDLTFEIQQYRVNTGDSLLAFSVGLVIYFLVAQLLIAAVRRVEHRASARVGRGPRFGRLSTAGASGEGAVV